MARPSKTRPKTTDPGPPGEDIAARANKRKSKIIYQGSGDMVIEWVYKRGKLPVVQVRLTPK